LWHTPIRDEYPEMMTNAYNLERFVDAQEKAQTYVHAVEELRQGSKRSHWMWFVFPQVAGLGSSSMSQTYAIVSLGEAQAYLRHAVLGPPWSSALESWPTRARPLPKRSSAASTR
jgi:uncharacterized protein (DUF1810 family)